MTYSRTRPWAWYAQIEASKDIDNDIQTIIEKFAERYPTHPILHTIAYY
jgi:hypothetical protein